MLIYNYAKLKIYLNLLYTFLLNFSIKLVNQEILTDFNLSVYKILTNNYEYFK